MGLLVQGLVYGVIDAAAVSIPSNLRANNLDCIELFDMTKIGKTSLTGTVVTRRCFIDQPHDTRRPTSIGWHPGGQESQAES
jgi:hypothetical protein